MEKITVEKNPPEKRLDGLGVRNWPIWTKEISTFPWTYSESETCFFLEGEVIVTPKNGTPVKMGKGDLVTFPSGMSCDWEIRVDSKPSSVKGILDFLPISIYSLCRVVTDKAIKEGKIKGKPRIKIIGKPSPQIYSKSVKGSIPYHRSRISRFLPIETVARADEH